MSLLDEPTDVVLLYPEVQTTDDDGNPVRVASSTPVSLIGRVQPITMLEPEKTTGQGVVITTYRLVCREFPAGAFARVSWAGRDWDIVGEPKRYAGSECTRHSSILLRARTPEAVA